MLPVYAFSVNIIIDIRGNWKTRGTNKIALLSHFASLWPKPYFAQSCARPQGKGPTAQANWLKIIDFSGAGSFAIAS